MSGSTDPLLKSIKVFLTDNEEDLLLRLGKCPNCRNSTLTEEEEMTETNDVIPTMRYFIKCGSCLSDYTVNLKITHVSQYATYKNGERIRPCPEKISKQVQSKQNEKDSNNEESNI